MAAVLIVIAVLLAIVLIRKIPVIGGNICAGLAIAGFLTLILNGQFNPGTWVVVFIDGLNRLAWIMFLALFGSVFAQINADLGAVDTVIGALNARFHNNPRILVVGIMAVLLLSGSLMGDAVAASTVIGMLTFGILVSMGISLPKVCCLVVMGASIGSIMPPMSQSFALAATLAGADPDSVLNIGYISVAIVFIVCAVYACTFLVKKDNRPGVNPEVEIRLSDRSAGEILRENWKTLLPVAFLILVVICRSFSFIGIDLGPLILSNICFSVGGESTNLYDLFASTTILTGITNGVVMSILCAIIFSLVFKKVRSNFGDIVSRGIKNAMPCVGVQIACAFMIGAFYYCGSIDAVADFCMGLNNSVLRIGAGLCLMVLGALTGSQSTAQNIINTFALPIVTATGTSPVFAALGGAHLAAGGQGLPPADLTTFVVAGLISAQFNKECDPIKSMLYMLPFTLIMCAIGFFFWFA